MTQETDTTTARSDAEKLEATLSAWEKSVKAATEAHGGLAPQQFEPQYDNNMVVRLDKFPLPALDTTPDTEALLNALIAECRFLVREVAFHSARLSPSCGDRMRFLSAAESLMGTGAKVGEAVARLRKHSAPSIEERRHHMVYEHRPVAAPTPSPLEKSPRLEKQ